MKYLAGFFLIIFCWGLKAQEISETLIIDRDVDFCKPGVTNKSPGKGLLLDYRIQPNFQLQDNNGQQFNTNTNTRFNSKLKIPLVVKPGFKLLLGFQYMTERYEFGGEEKIVAPLISRIDNRNLKTFRSALYVSKPLNEKYYTSFRLGVSYTGDYGNFVTLEDRYATYRAVGIFGIKKRSDLEYGYGIMFSTSFRNTIAIPFGFYNRTFNEKWGVELAIPISLKVRRNFAHGGLLLFGPEFNSRSYSLDVGEGQETTIFHYRRAAIETRATYMQRIKGWLWVEMNVGYATNLKAKIEDTSLGSEVLYNQTNGVFGSIGIFLAPPTNRKSKECLPPKQ